MLKIAKIFGFKSPNAAEEHLRALARKGAIEITPGTSRGIRIPTSELQGIPIIGEVAAGLPILAQEQVEDHLPIAPDFFKPKAHFMLRVKGMSMKDIGIINGDLLAVHKNSSPSNGQIVCGPN